jgi:hypothetical protein
MDKKAPRYTKNIFIAHKKHIMRTLNTYIQYENVSRIYIIFNFEHNKYQLLLDCVDKNNKEKQKNSLLDYEQKMKWVYDKTASEMSLQSEQKILAILGSTQTKSNLQKETIDAISKLIKEYTLTSDYNNFFHTDENIIFEKIAQILPVHLKKDYKPKYEDRSFKTNIAKKIYYLIKNQLTYLNLNQVHALENNKEETKKTIKQIRANIDNFIDDEMKIMEQTIKSLMGWSFHYADEFIASEWEIKQAIKNFDDPNYEKYNLSSLSLQVLIQELKYIQKKKKLRSEKEKLEAKTIQDFTQSMKEYLEASYRKEFEAYNNVIAYCKSNQIFFDDDAIKKYIIMVDSLYTKERNKKSLGIKRKKAIQVLDSQYPYLVEVKSKNNYYFRNKILRLHTFILSYKDKYRFNVDYSYFKQVELAKKHHLADYTKKELKELDLDWEVLEDIDRDEKASIRRTARLQRRLKQNITKEQHNFNLFYERLLAHIDYINEGTMEIRPIPLTIEHFEEYLEFINDNNQLRTYCEKNLDYTEFGDYIGSCLDIKREILDYIDEIYERIEEDLIAAGIDPNESENEHKNEKGSESNIDIAVEKAYLFKHLPEEMRPFFINYYKNKNNQKKDEKTEDDEERPF